MALKNLEQERARFAMAQVGEAITAMGDDNKKYYRSYVKKMPSLILNSGLVAAMAFAQKQKEDGKSKGYKLIYRSLFKWLKPPHSGLLTTQKDSLLNALLEKDSHAIRLMTYESIALLGWMKRMAEAEIEEEADND